MDRKKLIGISAATTLAGVAAVLLFFSGKEVHLNKVSPDLSRVETENPDVAEKTSVHDVQLQAQLPPLNTPLAHYHDELLMKAKSGDPNAACRLAAEYDFCSLIELSIDSIEGTIQQGKMKALKEGTLITQKDNPSELIFFVGDLLDNADHCKGVTPPKPADVIKLWRTAAIGGHIPSMRNYAAGNAFRWRDTLDNIQELSTYRNEAESIARKAAESGDILSYFALAAAYSPVGQDGLRSLLAQATGANTKESLTIYLQIKSHLSRNNQADKNIVDYVEGRIDRLINYLDPNQIFEAEQEAAKRVSQWPTPRIVDDIPIPSIRRGGMPPTKREVCGANY